VVQIVQHVPRLLEPAQIALLLILSKVMALADVILDITMIVQPTRASKQQKPVILDITMTVQIIVSLAELIAQPVLLTQVSAPNVSMAPQLTLLIPRLVVFVHIILDLLLVQNYVLEVLIPRLELFHLTLKMKQALIGETGV